MLTSSSVLLLLLFSFSPTVLCQTCKKDPSSTCRCTLDDGRVFDLTAAASTDPSKPRYSKTATSGGSAEIFLFNPCHGFSCGGGGGSNAAVCDTIPDVSYFQETGSQDSVKFQFSGNKLQMKYSSSGSYTSTITFTCSDTAGFGTFDMTANALDLVGTLSSKYACFSSPSPSPSSSSGLSIGDILLIVFFVALMVYLIVGILIQAFVRKQRGLDLVPNRTFWTSLPGNVKDGGRFVVAKVKGDKSSGGYSDI